jgi:DNA processing protein
VTDRTETAALVALLRDAPGAWPRRSEAARSAGSAVAALVTSQGLFAAESLERARHEIAGWRERQISVLSAFDPEYPENLRRISDPPPLLFVAGRWTIADERAVAVVGTRQPTPGGIRTAEAITALLVEHRYTVVSGLAAGIDTAVHRAVLGSGGRTIAVVGTGLDHCYPRQNAALQRDIVRSGGVVSRFWPESPPTRRSFPLRNAVSAGLSLATVVVEASHTSGTRIQARLALEQERLVVLMAPLLSQPWARELAARPGVVVATDAAEVLTAVQHHAVAQVSDDSTSQPGAEPERELAA